MCSALEDDKVKQYECLKWMYITHDPFDYCYYIHEHNYSNYVSYCNIYVLYHSQWIYVHQWCWIVYHLFGLAVSSNSKESVDSCSIPRGISNCVTSPQDIVIPGISQTQGSFCSVQLFGAGSHQIQWSSTGLLQSISAKPFHSSHRLDMVIVRPPGIDNGGFVVSPDTVWYARVQQYNNWNNIP